MTAEQPEIADALRPLVGRTVTAILEVDGADALVAICHGVLSGPIADSWEIGDRVMLALPAGATTVEEIGTLVTLRLGALRVRIGLDPPEQPRQSPQSH
jgi:hypothetical protein